MTLTHYELHAAGLRPELRPVYDKVLEEYDGKGMPAGELFARVVEGALTTDYLKVDGPEDVAGLLHATVGHYLKRQANPYSYGAVARDHDYQRLLTYLQTRLQWSPANIVTSMILDYQMLSHERAGKRVYQVSDGLADQLKHTELRGLLTDDLRLPYESILIQVPESCDFQVWNADTGWHRLRDIYITEDDVVGIEPETGLTRGWRILLCGETKSGEIGDDALSHFWVLLPPGKKLDESLDFLDKVIRRDDVSGKSFGAMVDYWRPLFSWAMNVVLYATWSDPGERIMQNREARQLWQRAQKIRGKSEKRKALMSKFQKLNAQARIVIGANVRVDRHGSESDCAVSGIQNVDSGGGRSWVRTRVAGHWRNQAHGQAHALRKLIFIQPFWKGPDDAPVRAPKHEVV